MQTIHQSPRYTAYLHPREPSPLMIWAGAAFAMGALYLLTVFLFSL